MATSLDPKQVVAFEEPLMSQVVQQEAFARFLVEKGVFNNPCSWCPNSRFKEVLCEEGYFEGDIAKRFRAIEASIQNEALPPDVEAITS